MPPKKTINKSWNGSIGFHTIIDVATRHLWTHPVRNKDPPIKFVNDFLTKHGIKNTDPSKTFKITTTKDGYLASSRSFENAVMEHHMQVEPIDQEEVTKILNNTPLDALIMTDGGSYYDRWWR